MRTVRMITLFFAFSLLLAGNLIAQPWHFRPDSLKTVTVTGKVIAQTLTFQDTLKYRDTVIVRQKTRYLLDTDGNGTADYELNFGPAWYSPDSSSAQRPSNGQQVTVTGGEPLHLTIDNLKIVVVYEINGNFWRDPFDAAWNRMGRYSHDRFHGGRGPMGYGFGFMHDSLTTTTLSGRVLVDTTFINERFFLDVNNDSQPDYCLNFGPFWYKPSSGAVRPKDGDNVEITGGLLNRTTYPMVIVYTINGQLWLDSTTLGKNLGGCWVGGNIKKQMRFHSPFDPKSSVTLNPGWATGHMGGGMMGGGMMNNDMFGQILELMPGDLPNGGQEKVLAAFEVSMFDQMGNNAMLRNGMRGSHMNFGSSAQVQLHFNDFQLRYGNFSSGNISAKYWDDNSNEWVTVSNAVVNTDDNTVSFQQNTLSNLIILTASQAVSDVNAKNAGVIGNYELRQNYPNPFNPSTVINYTITKAGMVTLKVYNILGREVATLQNGVQEAGVHSVQFNASDLPSGIYIYTLQAGQFTSSRKLMLLK
ncbi:MAG TPA: T9SS type A sorting domain-containing protein [Ignavibacteriales bacterium]|nr:T9SS type A sorting domain-containing protein [Ignavibacteriales bacterium]